MQKYYNDIDPIEAREWLDFFKNLRVFRGWSLDAIRNVLHYTKLCKFNSKQIVSANTKSATDIFIIKTGQVLVWTQLKRNTNSVTSYSNSSSFNFKETSTTSFNLNEKVTPTNSQDTPRSSKTDLRNLNINLNSNVFSKESFTEKSKNQSFNMSSKSRLLGHSESLRKSFNDSSFRLPDLNRKPSKKLEKTSQQLNGWDNYFHNQSSFFLQILKLRRGDVFGLDSNLVKDHPNCQLISDECEVFLINKDAFLNYTPIEFFEVLQYQYNEGFPSRDEIDTKFNEYLKWKLYRKKVFQETSIQRIRNKITAFR